MKVVLIVDNINTKVMSPQQQEVDDYLYDMLSTPVLDGLKFSDAYQQGRSDGKIHVYYNHLHMFHTGLLTHVIELLSIKYEVSVMDKRDKRMRGAQKTKWNEDYKLRDYQFTAVRKAMNNNGILQLPTGAGKCTTFDTRVLTAKGQIQIGKLYKTIELESTIPYIEGIETFDFKGFKEGNSSHIYQKKQTPVKRIKTQLGIELGATPQHRIIVLTKKGNLEWKYMRDMEINDIIAIRYNSNYFSKNSIIPKFEYKGLGKTDNITIPTKMNEKLAYVMGLFTGDGGLTVKNRIYFTNTNIIMMNLIDNLMVELYNKKGTIKGKEYSISSTYIKEHLNILGLKSVYAHQKEIPFTILNAERKIQISFLKGLFDTDGSVSRNIITYSTTSKELMIDVQLILLNLGIVCKYRAKKTTHRDLYELVIYSDFIKLYSEIIGFNHPKKLSRLEKSLLKDRNTNINKIPHIAKKLKNLWDSIPRSILKEKGITDTINNKLNGISQRVIQSYFYGKRDIPPYKLKLLLIGIKELYPNISKHDYFDDLMLLTDGLFFTKITNISNSIEDVYDFVIPKTHSFTANAIINHNTLIGAHLIHLIAQKACFIVHTRTLLYQTQKNLKTMLNVDIGIIGDGLSSVKDINVCSIQTLYAILSATDNQQRVKYNHKQNKFETERIDYDRVKINKIKKMVSETKLMIVDEVHHLSAETYTEVARSFKNSNWRFGLTATAWREDKKEIMLHQLLGGIIYQIDLSTLVESGHLVTPKIEFLEPVNMPGMNGKYSKALEKMYFVGNMDRNNLIADKVASMVEAGYKSILIIVKFVDHVKILAGLLLIRKILSVSVTGSIVQKKREAIIDYFKAGKVKVMISTDIFGEGFDMPIIDAVVMVQMGKSATKVFQYIGRALRPASDKEHALVIDVADKQRWFGEWFSKRLGVYAIEPVFRLNMIQKSWIDRIDFLSTQADLGFDRAIITT